MSIVPLIGLCITLVVTILGAVWTLSTVVLRLGRMLGRFETLEKSAEEREEKHAEFETEIKAQLARLEDSLSDIGMLKEGVSQLSKQADKFHSEVTELQVKTGIYAARKSRGDFR